MSKNPSIKITETEGRHYLSLYNNPDPVDPNVAASIIRELVFAFPDRNKEFWQVLSDHIARDKMCEEKLRDAVNNAIRNVKFLHIADILGNDRKVKLHTYGEMREIVYSGGYKQSDFTLVDKKKSLWKLNN